jgi:hypothetical protein
MITLGKPWKITKVGTITIPPNHAGPIFIEGFDFEGCSCREAAVLAMTHAIGELQFALMKHLQEAGGDGTAVID